MLNKKYTTYDIISICALAFMLIFMLAFASRQSLWLDELDWTVGIVTGKSFNHQGMFHILLQQAYNLPLYYMLVKPLYYIMPYGEIFLRIPSMLFVLFGVIILKNAGKKMEGEDLGFYTLCIAVTSSILITQGGWEFRPYSLMFFCAALTLLMFIKRLKQETNKNIVYYGLALLLLLYSHWFGSLLALFYAFTDLYLTVRKKIKLKCMLSYVLSGGLFLPWIILTFLFHVNNLGSYWGQLPNILTPITIIWYLLSDTIIYYLLFGFAVIYTLVKWFNNTEDNSCPVLNMWVFMILGIICVIVPICIYSALLNPQGSLFVPKYFFVIMPFVLLLTAYGITELKKIIQNKLKLDKRSRKFGYIIVIIIIVFIGFQNYRSAYAQITARREPYRETADYLAKDARIYDNNTLVASSMGAAWIEYYFNKRNYQIPANVVSLHKLNYFVANGQEIEATQLTKTQLLSFKYLYLFEVKQIIPKDFMDLLDNNYTMVKEIAGLSSPIIATEQPSKPYAFGLRLYSKK